MFYAKCFIFYEVFEMHKKVIIQMLIMSLLIYIKKFFSIYSHAINVLFRKFYVTDEMSLKSLIFYVTHYFIHKYKLSSIITPYLINEKVRSSFKTSFLTFHLDKCKQK